MIDHISVITVSHPSPPSRLLPLRAHANRSAQAYHPVIQETRKRNSTQYKHFYTCVLIIHRQITLSFVTLQLQLH